MIFRKGACYIDEDGKLRVVGKYQGNRIYIKPRGLIQNKNKILFISDEFFYSK
jgi:hypothetical protein